MNNKNDLRAKRTNKMIINAFIYLMETNDYNDITIQDIANEAMISRSTFYAHFRDKQDLYNHIFKQIHSAFIIALSPDQLVHNNCIKVSKIEMVLTNFFEQIQANQKFFFLIMNTYGIETIRKIIAEIIEVKYAHILKFLKIKEYNFEVSSNFFIEYLSSVFVGTLAWWITNKTSMSADSVTKLVIKLLGNEQLTIVGIDSEY